MFVSDYNHGREYGILIQTYVLYILYPAQRNQTLQSLTLDPNETIQEVEFPSRVWPGTPVGSSYLICLLCEAGVLSDFVKDVWRQRAVFVSLENHT